MMKIFNSKTVVGLFDNDQVVEQAVTRLQELGFGEDEDAIQIIDQHRLAQETPLEATGSGAIAQPGQGVAVGGPAAVFDPNTEAGTEGSSTQRSTFEFLMDQGLGEEEANFFSRHVADGGKLVLVETTEDRADEAAEVMKQASAKISTD